MYARAPFSALKTVMGEIHASVIESLGSFIESQEAVSANGLLNDVPCGLLLTGLNGFDNDYLLQSVCDEFSSKSCVRAVARIKECGDLKHALTDIMEQWMESDQSTASYVSHPSVSD